MRLPSFSLHQPTSVEDAVRLLGEIPEAKVLAGGTDLLVNMKHRVEAPPALVSLSRVPSLRGTWRDDGSTIVGAMTTLKQVQQDPVLGERFPALVQAASAVGSYRHQTMGSLAGNLCQNTRCRFFNQTFEWRAARSQCYKAGGQDCHAVGRKDVCFSTYSGDVAPALLVLGASVLLQGPAGVRELPLSELYSKEGRKPLALGESEIVTGVRLPDQAGNGRSQYEKHSLRGSIDFPIVGAAVWRDEKSMRVAFTAVDRAPVRASVLEAELDGQDLAQERLKELAPLASKSARVTKTTVQPVTYKRDLMAALFLRAARALA